jgi:hypothetical protein
VVLDMPERDIAGEVRFSAGAEPSVVLVNNQPLGGDGRLNWLFVPRLRADGWVRLGARARHLDGAVAYHDHNWGRFRWGDDFGWEWGSVLPTDIADPWSIVFMRMTDRRRHRSFSQALYLWRHDELVALFRDAAIQIRGSGFLRRDADCILPPPMRLVLDGAAADIPASIDIAAARSTDTVRAVIRPESFAWLGQPSEVRLDRSVVLAEISGTARITASIQGEVIGFAGAAIVELLHG